MALYAVDKPLYLTSHDAVEEARRLLGTRRVGHTGTLDPLATGLLLLVSDESTKLVPFLSGEDKEYIAWVSFGATTPTLDAEGPVSEEAPVRFERKDLESVLPSFLKLKEQVPPLYSAIKVGGKRAYEAAREGKPLELGPRPVRYLEVELLALDPEPIPHPIAPSAKGWRLAEKGGRKVELPKPLGPYPTAVIRLVVGPGTYVRAFARDLGEKLKTKAFLSGLVRTRIGKVGLERAVKLSELSPEKAIPETDVLPFPVVELSHTEARRVLEGVPLPIPALGYVALVDSRRRLLAIAEGDGFKLKIRRVFVKEA
ncbi:tRNA pseudouridine(55) synthase TruB [Thermus sp. PS18]|uniref:tRNA pseudouridine synthase B n=1 Tax=Thermus brevis TaxID=2862456 RepID=A0ABS7A0Q0_9DEIN|nr:MULTISPECIES: tRNA pseudouridine(55) synthase TruB [Thermus]MBW6394895.1 tRNA pseudouridine(55) synthase TruB [Thermus brevis]UZX15698.1 tRNA pseudouridine(55) synthase TruB [Thermus sp. PS18]